MMMMMMTMIVLMMMMMMMMMPSNDLGQPREVDYKLVKFCATYAPVGSKFDPFGPKMFHFEAS
eukprot:4151605-Karenia_brevis.AAC.1